MLSRILSRTSMAVIFLTSASMALGQNPSGTNAATGQTNPGQPKTMTLTQSVEPSFHIEPIVLRKSGRRGEVIPFEFAITSTGKSMDVIVTPVNLRQEESGIILHDAAPPSHSQLRLLTDANFRLAPGESNVIRGEVTVPMAKTNLLTYGILVRDRGQLSDPNLTTSDGKQTRAGVRFVTQYVLRVEIETGIQDAAEMARIALQQGRVRSERGLPVAQVLIENPTDFAMECSVDASISTEKNPRGKSFPLIMPSRAGLTGDDRNVVRVLPHSRIMVSTPLEGLLVPGDQNLKILVNHGRRALIQQSFPFSVHAGDYPAMETRIAFLGNDSTVQPAQIQLGYASDRTCNVRLTNHAAASQRFKLRAMQLDGGDFTGISLSNDAVEIGAGRTKSVRAVVAGGDKRGPSRCGYLEIRTEQESADSLPLGKIPFVLQGPDVPPTQVVAEELVTVDSRFFQLVVVNQGEGFVPVHAELNIDDGQGGSLQLADGYEKWLAPGETRRLRFVPERAIPAGEYQLRLQLLTHPDEPPMQKALNIKLTEPLGASA